MLSKVKHHQRPKTREPFSSYHATETDFKNNITDVTITVFDSHIPYGQTSMGAFAKQYLLFVAVKRPTPMLHPAIESTSPALSVHARERMLQVLSNMMKVKIRAPAQALASEECYLGESQVKLRLQTCALSL
mmetsp:Transcript_21101/g.40285  ORF Transcript_21101/g.40285 Transcript_21101/m.40285 type:complete len:132 (-) Transcript_21101:125-520(-)